MISIKKKMFDTVTVAPSAMWNNVCYLIHYGCDTRVIFLHNAFVMFACLFKENFLRLRLQREHEITNWNTFPKWVSLNSINWEHFYITSIRKEDNNENEMKNFLISFFAEIKTISISLAVIELVMETIRIE